ncbi:hypothetical protein FRB93_009041 [Tulasnella sp. JGI-2019a]|nr:hypothetical protein FRB93_009041 [Tulasnella sp. JGI-2019a]
MLETTGGISVIELKVIFHTRNTSPRGGMKYDWLNGLLIENVMVDTRYTTDREAVYFGINGEIFICDPKLFLASSFFSMLLRNCRGTREEPISIDGVTAEEFSVFGSLLQVERLSGLPIPRASTKKGGRSFIAFPNSGDSSSFVNWRSQTSSNQRLDHRIKMRDTTKRQDINDNLINGFAAIL